MAYEIIVNEYTRNLIRYLLNYPILDDFTIQKYYKHHINNVASLLAKLGAKREGIKETAEHFIKSDEVTRSNFIVEQCETTVNHKEATKIIGKAKYNKGFTIERIVASSACPFCQERKSGPVSFEEFGPERFAKHGSCKCSIILRDPNGKITQYG